MLISNYLQNQAKKKVKKTKILLEEFSIYAYLQKVKPFLSISS